VLCLNRYRSEHLRIQNIALDGSIILYIFSYCCGVKFSASVQVQSWYRICPVGYFQLATWLRGVHCQVYPLYVNLGCCSRIASYIDWYTATLYHLSSIFHIFWNLYKDRLIWWHSHNKIDYTVLKLKNNSTCNNAMLQFLCTTLKICLYYW
jgi:hypothetical protein